MFPFSVTFKNSERKNSSNSFLPNFFDNLNQSNAKEITSAKILGVFGDSITTDHISPAGNIAVSSPAAEYLKEKSVDKSVEKKKKWNQNCN